MAADAAHSAMFHELKVGPVIGKGIAAIHLTEAERLQILRWIRSPTTAHRLVVRSRIVLLASEGLLLRDICRRLHTRPTAVRRWCDRFRRRGLSASNVMRRAGAGGLGRRPP